MPETFKSTSTTDAEEAGRRDSKCEDIDQSDLDSGPSISDVTEEYDNGYEADVDSAYPDGFEEPGESDKESDRSQHSRFQKAPSLSLVKHFRELRCGRNGVALPRRSVGASSTLKRSHSEDSLTSPDPDLVDDSTSSTPEQRRAKRRITTPVSSTSIAYLTIDDEAMDIDDESPSKSNATNTARS